MPKQGTDLFMGTTMLTSEILLKETEDPAARRAIASARGGGKESLRLLTHLQPIVMNDPYCHSNPH